MAFGTEPSRGMQCFYRHQIHKKTSYVILCQPVPMRPIGSLRLQHTPRSITIIIMIVRASRFVRSVDAQVALSLFLLSGYICWISFLTVIFQWTFDPLLNTLAALIRFSAVLPELSHLLLLGCASPCIDLLRTTAHAHCCVTKRSGLNKRTT